MRMGAWHVQLDPWAVEYGSETPGAASPDDDAGADVDVDVETIGSRWAPVGAPSTALGAPVVFVDGVRRIEARLVITNADTIVHGAISTYGVGAVHTGEGRASFGNVHIDRLLIFGGGILPAASVTLGPGLHYRPTSVADHDVDAPIRGLHHEMRVAEQEVAETLAEPGTIVIADGPLNITRPGPHPVLGFVKRLFELYVPSEQLSVIRSLPTGSRSPVFLIRSAARFARYSWFVRLGAPLRVESEFTGIVRLEVAEACGVQRAIALANAVTGWLPRFVPTRTRDPRAPQNLIPIGALEHHLRHEMGDVRIIKRRLASWLAQEPVNA
jgi:hypothetical protein